MAKVSLNKVTPIKNIDPKVINIGGEEIVITQYLPMADKITFVENVMAHCIDNNGLSSPIRTEVYFYLELIKAYTNISLTDKMIENSAKTYDMLEMNDIVNVVVENIPEAEFETIFNYVLETIEKAEQHNTSFAGVLKSMTSEYNGTQMDVEDLITELGKIESNGLLRDTLNQLS